MQKLAPTDRDIAALLEPHRVELTGYCYRMLGSAFEAEDAVQESFLRAWRGFEAFEARASLRSWLYRITTNVCLSMVSARQRRARPLDLCAPWDRSTTDVAMLEENSWIEPVPDALVLPAQHDPAAQLAARESIRLAFLAALQLLPARQRAVLILRDVLHWQAREVAELLETSEISVQSALQRARGTLAEEQARVSGQARSSQLQDHGLLDRYVDAFSRWDVDQLISLLHEDATQTMPPHALTPVDLAELHKRDVTFACIARAPLEAIERYKRELGFTFLWYSSHGSDFNYDFHVTLDASKAPIEYNYMSHEQLLAAGYPNEILKGDWPANSVFLREGDQVFHTYTAFARGLDQNAPTYAFLDLTVYGRQEPWEDSPAGWPQPMRRPPE